MIIDTTEDVHVAERVTTTKKVPVGESVIVWLVKSWDLLRHC